MLKVAINAFQAIKSCGCISSRAAGQLLQLIDVCSHSPVWLERTVSAGATLAPFSTASKGPWTKATSSTVLVVVWGCYTGGE